MPNDIIRPKRIYPYRKSISTTIITALIFLAILAIAFIFGAMFFLLIIAIIAIALIMFVAFWIFSRGRNRIYFRRI